MEKDKNTTQEVKEEVTINIDDPKVRVQLELAQLNEKISKLSLFLYSEKSLTLKKRMRYVMEDQLRNMQHYAKCLIIRLEIWDLQDDEEKHYEREY